MRYVTDFERKVCRAYYELSLHRSDRHPLVRVSSINDIKVFYLHKRGLSKHKIMRRLKVNESMPGRCMVRFRRFRGYLRKQLNGKNVFTDKEKAILKDVMQGAVR